MPLHQGSCLGVGFASVRVRVRGNVFPHADAQCINRQLGLGLGQGVGLGFGLGLGLGLGLGSGLVFEFCFIGLGSGLGLGGVYFHKPTRSTSMRNERLGDWVSNNQIMAWGLICIGGVQ